MSDIEFTLLDELYFVISFPDLESACELSEEEMLDTLRKLREKGWIRVLETVDDEIVGAVNWERFREYFYLASKSGLMAHNSA